MIPRLKPYISLEEVVSLFKPNKNAVSDFETNFGKIFNCRHAIAFPYGRSALWAFFNAMGLENSEIVQPAYTCSVVGHATVLSGNIPVFVDINLHDYNMNLDLFRKAITPKTRAVIPTHLFGYPMDVDSVSQIVREAEKSYGHRIYIIQDCAHSFEAEWQGKSVINYGDCALFGLNISKQITSIFGGMITSNSDEIAEKVRIFRDHTFNEKSVLRKISRFIYLPAALLAFNNEIYGFTYWLQHNTRLLKQLTDAYHLDAKISLPPDYQTKMAGSEAQVGLAQLNKYREIKIKRRQIAEKYFNQLNVPKTWVLPPKVKGATYSHFVIRVPDRDRVIADAAKHGIQLGQLIEYSMPHLPGYQKYTNPDNYPNSKLCSRTLINLPIYPGLNNRNLEKVINIFQFSKNSTLSSGGLPS